MTRGEFRIEMMDLLETLLSDVNANGGFGIYTFEELLSQAIKRERECIENIYDKGYKQEI